MGLITTKAIVLSSLKYSESSLIVKCYTEELGLISFIERGVLKSKKRGNKMAHFQPLNQLIIVFNYKNKNALSTIKESRILHPYQNIPSDIIKQTMVLFLSEILSKAIQGETEDKQLFQYLVTALDWLDVHEHVANFHLLFLLNLTKFLGFYPDLTHAHYPGFDMLEGRFSENLMDKHVISKNEFYQFKKLLGINFDKVETVTFSKQERQLVLQTLIHYFKLHLGNFSDPKSLPILETVFN
jgi:DNA repair protein RecO (recombination protein O)